jgi:hypothetical protein
MLLTATGFGDNGELSLDNSNVPIDNTYPSVDFVAQGDTQNQNVEYINFDFAQFYDSGQDIYTDFLSLYFSTHSGQSETIEDFTVVFSDLTFSEGTNLVIKNPTPNSGWDLLGFSATVDNQDLVLDFTNYFVAGEGVSIDIYFEIGEDTDPNTTVVPVPAAAPMALLGLGVLALARRFRRTKS